MYISKKRNEMNIDNSFVSNIYKDINSSVNEKIQNSKNISGRDISNQYLAKYQLEIMNESKIETTKQVELFSLSDIGYKGKPIANLNQEEAKKLVSEDGFFGVAQTSERIANFVLLGAGDDIDKLKAGKEGILRGFKEAEEMWGEKLPDISYESINKSVEMIDKKLSELGASVMDINV